MYHRLRPASALVAAWLAGAGSAAAARDCALPPPDLSPAGRIATVIDGDTVAFEKGADIRMIGIQAPKLPLGRDGFEAWPLAPEAKAFLEEIALEREAVLWSPGLARDRYGRTLAQVYVMGEGDEPPVWLQGAMIEAGLARVYSFPDNRGCVEQLLAMEAEARAAGRGMWGHPAYRILSADDLDDLYAHMGEYVLVEGRVKKVGVVRGRAYLNFADDWQSDFTVTMAPRDLKLFKRIGADVARYEGELIRARGWLRSFNGPVIEATHPEQIEVLR